MIDDIKRKYNEYLTKAQIRELEKRAELYKQTHAEQRAEALADVRSQYDTGRVALQNMGLASRNGNVISGKEKGMRAPLMRQYQDYNRKLGEVEHAYTERAAAQMANETIRARAAAARRRAEHEAAINQMQRVKLMDEMTDPRISPMTASEKVENANQQKRYNPDLMLDPRMQQRGDKRIEMQNAQVAAMKDVYRKGIDTDQRMMLNATAPEKAQYAKTIPAVRAYNEAEQAIRQNSAKWNAEINNTYSPRDSVGKSNKNKAIQEKAAAESKKYRAYAAINYPQYAQYLLMPDDQFAVSYDAVKKQAERLNEQARQERNKWAVTSNTTRAGFAEKEQHRINAERYEAEAMRILSPWDEANKLRKGTGEAPSLAETVNVPASDKTKDKTYTDMTEYVFENQKNWKAVPWASKREWNGSNWKEAYNRKWEADDYKKTHDTYGSKYDALINEWSFINGRTALLYTQKFQNVSSLSNIGEVVNQVFGGDINRDYSYRWFRDECVMSFNRDYETSGTKVQKEQMDAMLTLANLMTDEERARFNGMLKVYGAKYADEYFEYLYNNVLPQRFLQYTQGEMAFDTRDTLGRLEQSIMSVPTNIVQGVTKPIQTMFSEQNDPVAAQLSASKANTAQTMRGAIGANFDEVGNFLYQSGMSMADSATVALISQGLGNVFSGALKGFGVAAETAAKIGGKVGSALGGSILGGSAYNSSYDEALQRGLSPDQARKTALGNGVNEMLFEAVSLDLLVDRFKTGDIVKVSKKAWKNWVVNTLLQAGVEGSEEVFTDMANNFWDKSINKIYSEELAKVRQYLAEGKSYEEAKKLVSEEYGEQLWQSFLGGALSGGVMGGGAGALNAFNSRTFERIGKTTNEQDIRGYDFKDKEAAELAKQSKLTNAELGMLWTQRQQELLEQYHGDIQQAVADGRITAEDAAILEKYEKNGVQQTKDGKVIGNENGITADEFAKAQEAIAELDSAARIQFLDNEQTRELAQVVGSEVASAYQQNAKANTEANKTYYETVAAINADTTLSAEQKQQRIEEAERTRADTVSTAASTFDQTWNKSGNGKLKVGTDENGIGYVETKKGSGKVTFDFTTIGHNTLDTMTGLEQAALRIAQVVASRGVNVKVESEFGVDKNGVDHRNENGYYERDTQTIHVNLSGDNSVLWTVSHELTHHLANVNKQAYNDLRDAIKSELQKSTLTTSELEQMGFDYDVTNVDKFIAKTGNLWDALVQYEAASKEEGGRGYGENAEEEVVARCCESFLANDVFVRSFAKKNFKSAKAISSFLTQMSADMNQLFTDAELRTAKENIRTDESPERQILAQVANVQEIAQKWSRAVNALDSKRKAAKQAEGVRASRSDEILAMEGVDWVDKKKTIRQQLAAHREEINALPRVYSIEYAGEQGNALIEAIQTQVRAVGGSKIKNGNVEFVFDKKGIASLYNYATDDGLRAAAIISPYVAKYGIIIAGKQNHKDRGYTTLTYAAPVTINGIPANVGVVIQFSRNGRVHSMNVETDVGEKLKIQKADKGQYRASLVTKRGDLLTESASNDNISSKKDSVNRPGQTKASIFDREYLDLAKRYESGDKSVEAELWKAVDAAAKAAGYKYRLYRGDGSVHNVFDTKRGKGTTQYGQGTYFTDAKGLAEEWTLDRAHDGEDGYVGEYYVRIGTLFDDENIDTSTRQWKKVESLLKQYGATDRQINIAKEWGFRGIQRVLDSLGKAESKTFFGKGVDETNSILQNAGYDGIKGEFYDAMQYVIFDPTQAKSADLITKDDNGNIIPLSERFNTEKEDIRYSVKDNVERNVSPETVMTMQQAKRMLEMTFNANRFRGYKGYKTADEWLQSEGAAEVAWYAENTETVVNQYFNRFPELTDYEVTIEEVLEAYQNGTLVGKEKTAKETIDLKTGNGYKDSRFYAPKLGSVTEETIRTANLRVTSTNRDKVYAARRDVLFAAHTKEGIAALGLTQKELNKRLQNWSRYSERARTLSMKLNQGVAEEYWWTGLQNSSILSTINVTDQDIRSLVKDIIGTSSEYQRNYIGRTMLALDTHIDWSELTFEFTRTANAKEGARGYYDDNNRHIAVGNSGYLNTVAHEMGHALDYKWGRDLFTKMSVPITQQHASNESKIASEDGRKFYHHFAEFSQKVEDACDIRSSYTQRGTEAFARFVARFVEWTANTAGSQSNYEAQYYNDRFTTGLYLEFVQILQEKARLDSMARNETRASKMDKVRLSTANATLAGQMHEGAKGARALREQSERYNERIDELNGRIGKLNKRIAELKTQIEDVSLAERMHQGAEDAAALRKVRDEYNERIAQRDRLLEQVRKQRDAAKQHAVEVRKQEREARVRRDIITVLKRGNDRIVKMLANPTENSHVPVQLAQTVSEYAIALNDILTKSEPKTGEFAGMEKQTQKGALNARKIIDAYNRSFADEETISLAKAENPNFNPRGLLPSSEYDETLVKMINAMDSIVKNKHISDLTTEELRFVMNTMRGVIHTVYDANKLIGTSERKAIWQVGSQMVDQLENAPKISKGMRGYLETSLDLRRIALAFSGSNKNAEFVKLVDQLNRGAIEKERVAQTLAGMFDGLTQQYGDEISKWYGKNAEWIDTGITKNGKTVEITKGMRVSLAMHVLNEGNMRHIENGGLTIPDRELYRKGNLSDAYANGTLVRLSAEQINDIISHMTEAEKAYVETAKEFFHKRTGYYVNRTSLQLLGYRKATVENYFPIHTDRNFTKTDFASLKMDGSIEGQGFLKERVNASNPVYLEDITSVVNRQIRGVALYAGLAVPMRNFNAVMNAAVYEDDNGVWSPRTTVKQTMTKTMGEYGAKIVEGFLTDVSEMSHVDVTPMERFAGKLATNYVKAVLLGNLKVAMKQVASYPTAAAVIPWKYLSKALVKGGRNGRIISRADVDLINQYTPLYQMRREGNANEIASIMQRRGLEQRLPWLLGWITKMDVMTVGRLWSAAEYMVADQQKNLTVGSDEYYKAVAKVFNETVQQTQPNFTPLQRNAALRSKNPIVRSLVLFGTQRMQNGGILIEAALELKNSKGKSKAEIKAARAKLGRAVASQIVQNILLLVASAGVDVLRGRMKGWQDKDKEITVESVSKNLGDSFLSNFVGSFLGGSEVYSAISGLYKTATGETAYDTEFTVPALDAIETIIKFAQSDIPNAVKYLSGDHTDDEKKKKLLNVSMQLAKVAGYATGIPLENAVKDVFKGIIPAVQDVMDWKKTGELNPWLHQSGKLDSKKSSTNYKEWTKLGYKGSTYLYWENKLKDVKGGYEAKAEELFADQSLPAEEKAILLRMLSDGEYRSEGAIVYNKNDEVVADFTSFDTLRVSMLSDKKYQGFKQAVSMSVQEDYAATAFIQYTELKKGEDANNKFREWLKKRVSDPEQRAILEMCVIGGDGETKRYEYGKKLVGTGMSSDKAYTLLETIRDVKKKDIEPYLKGLTEVQKKLIYEMKKWKYE